MTGHLCRITDDRLSRSCRMRGWMENR